MTTDQRFELLTHHGDVAKMPARRVILSRGVGVELSLMGPGQATVVDVSIWPAADGWFIGLTFQGQYGTRQAVVVLDAGKLRLDLPRANGGNKRVYLRLESRRPATA